jgi:2-dehydro-3-deoxygalactonokinase
LNVKGPALIVLPGSHSKFIMLNEENQITACITSLAGELLSVITKSTILSSAVESSFSKSLNEQMLLKGAQCAQKVGLNRACFSVRILDQFTQCSTNDKANFLEGIIFGTDLLALKNSGAFKVIPEIPVIIGGSEALKRSFEILIRNDSYFKGEIKVVDAEYMKDMAGFGAILAAKERNLI